MRRSRIELGASGRKTERMNRCFRALEVAASCGGDFAAITRKRIEGGKSVGKFRAVDLNEAFFALGDVADIFPTTVHSRPNQTLQPTAATGRG